MPKCAKCGSELVSDKDMVGQEPKIGMGENPPERKQYRCMNEKCELRNYPQPG
jgi:hypothetical protein